MQKTFWDKNKVFILGLLASIAVVLQQFVGQPDSDVKWKAVGFAVMMAILSYLARNWRGQGISIIGIIGNLAGVFVTIHETGQFSWIQFILQGSIAIIAAAGADPKSRGYENTPVIKDAKKEGETIQPASLTAKPK